MRRAGFCLLPPRPGRPPWSRPWVPAATAASAANLNVVNCAANVMSRDTVC